MCGFCMTRDTKLKIKSNRFSKHLTSPSHSPALNHFWSYIFGRFDRTERKQWEKGTRSGKGLEQGLKRSSPEVLLCHMSERLKLPPYENSSLTSSVYIKLGYRKCKLVYSNFLYILFKMVLCVFFFVVVVVGDDV